MQKAKLPGAVTSKCLYNVDDCERVLCSLAKGETPRLARFQAWRLDMEDMLP